MIIPLSGLPKDFEPLEKSGYNPAENPEGIFYKNYHRRRFKLNNAVTAYDKPLLTMVSDIEYYINHPENNKCLLQKAFNHTVLFTFKEAVKGLMPHHFPYNAYGLCFVYAGEVMHQAGMLYNSPHEAARGEALTQAGALYLTLPEKSIKQPVLKFKKIVEEKLQAFDKTLGIKIGEYINRKNDRAFKFIEGNKILADLLENPKGIAFWRANIGLIDGFIDSFQEVKKSVVSAIGKFAHSVSASLANYFSIKAQITNDKKGGAER